MKTEAGAWKAVKLSYSATKYTYCLDTDIVEMVSKS